MYLHVSVEYPGAGIWHNSNTCIIHGAWWGFKKLHWVNKWVRWDMSAMSQPPFVSWPTQLPKLQTDPQILDQGTQHCYTKTSEHTEDEKSTQWALSFELSICSAFLTLSYSNWNLTIPWRHCPPGRLTSRSYFSYTLPTNGPRAEVASLILISFQITDPPLLPLSSQLRVLPTRIPTCCSHLPTLVITFIHQRC